MKNSSRLPAGGLVLAFLFAFACVPDLFAQKDEGEVDGNLNGWGKLGKNVSGSESFYDFSYFFKDERGRKKSAKAFVQISEKTTLYLDRVVRIQDLKKGARFACLPAQSNRRFAEVHPVEGGGMSGRGEPGPIARFRTRSLSSSERVWR